MRKILLFLLFSIAIKVFAQTSQDEVVYLKNGSIIRGTIIEQIPNEKIKIQTSEGNVFVYKYDEIEKITKEPKIINPNAYQSNTNNFSDEVKHHKSKVLHVLQQVRHFCSWNAFYASGTSYS
ncbi:MAG: hypothetical protein IPH74_16085 [Bacteroidetes bacterium]|nr:hypothetical protein [Bacteroidota bacterium]